MSVRPPSPAFVRPSLPENTPLKVESKPLVSIVAPRRTQARRPGGSDRRKGLERAASAEVQIPFRPAQAGVFRNCKDAAIDHHSRVAISARESQRAIAKLCQASTSREFATQGRVEGVCINGRSPAPNTPDRTRVVAASILRVPPALTLRGPDAAPKLSSLEIARTRQ